MVNDAYLRAGHHLAYPVGRSHHCRVAAHSSVDAAGVRTAARAAVAEGPGIAHIAAAQDRRREGRRASQPRRPAVGCTQPSDRPVDHAHLRAGCRLFAPIDRCHRRHVRANSCVRLVWICPAAACPVAKVPRVDNAAVVAWHCGCQQGSTPQTRRPAVGCCQLAQRRVGQCNRCLCRQPIARHVSGASADHHLIGARCQLAERREEDGRCHIAVTPAERSSYRAALRIQQLHGAAVKRVMLHQLAEGQRDGVDLLVGACSGHTGRNRRCCGIQGKRVFGKVWHICRHF